MWDSNPANAKGNGKSLHNPMVLALMNVLWHYFECIMYYFASNANWYCRNSISCILIYLTDEINKTLTSCVHLFILFFEKTHLSLLTAFFFLDFDEQILCLMFSMDASVLDQGMLWLFILNSSIQTLPKLLWNDLSTDKLSLPNLWSCF